MKQLKTKMSPPMYQGFLCPMGVLNLSESMPTIGVAIPSQICPESMAADAAGVITTLLRKKKR